MADIQCMMHQAGKISRNRPALIAEDIRIQYGELDLMVSATAALLRTVGIGKGDRVAVYMESGWAYATLIFALMRVGAIVCPISTRLPLQGVKEQLAFIDGTTLIARVSESSREALSDILCLDPDGLVSRQLSSGQAADSFDMPLDQPASIVFTSASSGRPKAVLQTYGNHYYSAYGASLNVRLRSDDCWLLSLPLYHVGGLGILFRCVQTGAAVAVMTPSDSLDQALPKFPVTHLSVVPTQLRRLIAQDVPAEVRKRLKAVLVGGSGVSAELLEAARAAGYPVIPSYGLSEMNSQVTACTPFGPREKANTAGKVLRHREVRIAEDGEIQVKGQTLFSGYVEQGRVDLPVDEDGWFSTGDLGRLDEDGYLTVSGRKDSMFVSGGENIYPEEIEQVMLGMDGVHQAVVVPVPSEEYGARPVAFLDRSGSVTDDALRKQLQGMLPKFKIPDAFYPWPEEDRARGAMKPERFWFREQAEKRR